MLMLKNNYGMVINHKVMKKYSINFVFIATNIQVRMYEVFSINHRNLHQFDVDKENLLGT